MPTFQDLLNEFASRRMKNAEITDPVNRDIDAIHNLEWAVQSIIERLRDAEARINFNAFPPPAPPPSEPFRRG